MILKDVVFFPQSILPLHIFEPRYRNMLRDVLEGNRLFAVASVDEDNLKPGEDEEPPASVATVGMVRASHDNADGTSNLILQGICRVKVAEKLCHSPYPVIQIHPLTTPPDYDAKGVARMKARISDMLMNESCLSNGVPEEFIQFLGTIEDPDTFIDLSAFAMCQCSNVKQALLEAVDLHLRYQTFLRYLSRKQSLKGLFKQLQGSLEDEDIELN